MDVKERIQGSIMKFIMKRVVSKSIEGFRDAAKEAAPAVIDELFGRLSDFIEKGDFSQLMKIKPIEAINKLKDKAKDVSSY